MPGHAASTVRDRAAGFLDYRLPALPVSTARKVCRGFCLLWINSFRKDRLQKRDMGYGCNISLVPSPTPDLYKDSQPAFFSLAGLSVSLRREAALPLCTNKHSPIG